MPLAPSSDKFGGLSEDAIEMNKWEDDHLLGEFSFSPADIRPCPPADERNLWVIRPLDDKYAAGIVQLTHDLGTIPASNIMLVVDTPELFTDDQVGPLSSRIPQTKDMKSFIIEKKPMPFSGGHTSEALKKQFEAHPLNKLWAVIPHVKVIAADLSDSDHVDMLRRLGRRVNLATENAKKMDYIHIIRDVHKTLMATPEFREFVANEGDFFEVKDAFVLGVVKDYVKDEKSQPKKMSTFRDLVRMAKTYTDEWLLLDGIFDTMTANAKDGNVTTASFFYANVQSLPRSIRIQLIKDNADKHGGIPKSSELKAEAEAVKYKAHIHNYILDVYESQRKLLNDVQFTPCSNFEEVIAIVPALGNPAWIEALYNWSKQYYLQKNVPEVFGSQVTNFMTNMSTSPEAMARKVHLSEIYNVR